MTFKEYIWGYPKSISNGGKYLSVDKQISDISGIEKYTKLRIISICHNRITDLSPLKSLKNLEEIIMYDNKIEDLKPLKDLKNLKELYLWNNKITDITPLSNLNIQRLALSHNYIVDPAPLYNMNSLTSLSISDNRLSDGYNKYNSSPLWLVGDGLEEFINIIKIKRRKKLIELL